VGTPGGKKGGKKKSGRGEPKCCRRKRSPQREERAHQEPPTREEGRERRAHRQGTQAGPKESDVLGYYMCHLSSLYPKLKFTSEFSLTPLKKLL
jgi:hypothetical protein